MPAAPHGTGAKPARWPARVAGGLLALAVWVAQGLQPVAAQPADAHAALLATPLVPPATQWFHLADALAQARAQPGDEDRATLLRHRLLAAHIAALNGSPSLTPTPTVATLIAQAAPLPQADAALIDAWQRAFNRHVQLRLADAQRGPPFELAYLGRQLMPLGPGAWTMDASGRARYFWVLHLVNRSPTALPLPAFRLQADGLLLDCTPPAALPPGQPAPPGDALTDPGELVAPGAERPFVCRAFEGPEFRELLRARLAGRGTTPVQLLPANLASAAGVDSLIAALGQGQEAARESWVQRLRASQPSASTGPAAATSSQRAAATSGQGRAEPPRDLRSRWDRLRSLLALGAAVAGLAVTGIFVWGGLQGEAMGDRMGRALRVAGVIMGLALLLGLPWTQQLLGSAGDELGGRATRAMRESIAQNDTASAQRGMRPASGLEGLEQRTGLELKSLGLIAVLALFGVGRLGLRMGVPRGAVMVGTALVMALACLASLVSVFADGSLLAGDGWARLGAVVVPVIIVGIFFALALVPLLLHMLHFQLDDDGLSWPGTVWAGLRQSLNFGGTATLGEFWGFVAFALLAAVLAGGFNPRAAWVALLVLALPTAAVAARRLRAMTSTELWGLAAALGMLLLQLLTAD